MQWNLFQQLHSITGLSPSQNLLQKSKLKNVPMLEVNDPCKKIQYICANSCVFPVLKNEHLNSRFPLCRGNPVQVCDIPFLCENDNETLVLEDSNHTIQERNTLADIIS